MEITSLSSKFIPFKEDWVEKKVWLTIRKVISLDQVNGMMMKQNDFWEIIRLLAASMHMSNIIKIIYVSTNSKGYFTMLKRSHFLANSQSQRFMISVASKLEHITKMRMAICLDSIRVGQNRTAFTWSLRQPRFHCLRKII